MGAMFTDKRTVVVDDLKIKYATSGMGSPAIVLVNGAGGPYVNVYARSFPGEVTGVILLDAAAPEDAGLVSEYSTAIQRAAQRLLDALFRRDELGEVEYVSDTVDLIEQAGPFPPVPLVVVTGGKPSRVTPRAVRMARADHQAGLAALSPLGRQVIAGGSGHFPQMSEPVVVVEAIREVLALAVVGGMADRGIQRTPHMLE